MKKILMFVCICTVSALLAGCSKSQRVTDRDDEDDDTEEVTSSRNGFDYNIFVELSQDPSSYTNHMDKMKSIINNSESSDAELMAATMFFIHSGQPEAQEMALEGYDKLIARKADVGKLLSDLNERLQNMANAQNLQNWAESVRSQNYTAEEEVVVEAVADSAAVEYAAK